jgi:precorrin-4 C11-methyltransferase/prolipoprotein diacylglyceryl transferase
MPLATFASPGPLVFQLGPFALRWYGLLIAGAVLLGLLVAMRLGRERSIEPALIADLLPLLVLGAVVGARIYYVALEWRQYQSQWLDVFAIWRGGIAIHGALLGGTLMVILFCRWRRQPFWPLLDVLMPAVALGQAIGRWGNFFNSEAFGLPTNLPWKLTIPIENRPPEFLAESTFHPTFLYESLWNLGVFALLLLLFRMGSRGRIQLPPGCHQLRVPDGLQRRPGMDRSPAARPPLPVLRAPLLRWRAAHGPADEPAADRPGGTGPVVGVCPPQAPPRPQWRHRGCGRMSELIPVKIVGAGPGAPDLMTLRAARAIEEAQVLVWTDSLVNPQIAAQAPAACERIRTSSLTLEEVMDVVIKRARAGLRVVRLHDGDPCLYGALAEQISRLADAGLEVEVVPGISAYQATASALGAELTIPGLVQTIVLSRAGGRTGVPPTESLGRLAALRASLCLYLSARHVDEVEAELLEHYPADTPVAIGHRVSWPDQWLTCGAVTGDGGHQPGAESDPHHPLRGESGPAGPEPGPLQAVLGQPPSPVPRRGGPTLDR